MNLLDLIKPYALSRPQSLALVAPGYEPISFERLWQQVTKLGSELNQLGIGQGDRVGLMLPDGPEMAIAFLATASHSTCAPLNPAFRQSEYEFYLDDLKPKALIVNGNEDHPAVDVAESKGILVLGLTTETHNKTSFAITPKGRSVGLEASDTGSLTRAKDVALVLHTSGTTSRQKTVPLTHKNIFVSIGNIVRSLQLTSDDRCLNLMPLFHIHGFMAGLLSNLTVGGSVVCPPGFIAPAFFDWLRLFDPTWYTAVPTMHRAVLARPELSLHAFDSGRLRFIRSSSAPLTVQVASDLEATFGVPVVEAYGMTEAAHQICVNPLPPAKRKPGSVGPVAAEEVAVFNPKGERLPFGNAGEIVIRGDNVMGGYLDNPDDNTEAFSHGWFRTGDLGMIDEEGFLFLTGRKKEIINRGGENISPNEVDATLLKHPAVAQAMTFPVPDDKLGEEVAAVVVLENGANVGTEEIVDFASQYLANFKVPRQIIFMDELPTGPTGKLQRIGLAEQLNLTATAKKPSPAYAAPQTDLEQDLIHIWKEILRVDRVGIQDNFFDVGGDSILAMQVLSRIQSKLAIELPLGAMFKAPTVGGFAQWATEANATLAVSDRTGLQRVELISSRKESNSPSPLSFAQQRIWFLCQLEPDNPLYNGADAFRLKGCLDIQALQKSLTALISRHAVLRTTYGNEAGVPVQIVETSKPVEVLQRDLSRKREAPSEKAIQYQVNQEVRSLFDLSQDLMLRACLLRLGDEEHILILTTHHIATDGWSSEVMLRELGQLYGAFSANQEPQLPDLPIQYPDYAIWHRQWLQGDRLDRQLAYWQDRLEGSPGLLELPTDRPRPIRQTYRGAVEKFTIAPEHLSALKALSQQEGVTLFMTLLAAFQTLLFRYTGAEDISVGSPIAGRVRSETEGLIGLFMNTLVFRTDLSGTLTFRQLLARIREVALGAYANQDLPFEKIVEALRVERHLSHAPLIQVMFNFRNTPSEDFVLPGLVSQEFSVNTGTTLFDLTMTLEEKHSNLEGLLEYATDLFQPQTIKRMSRHLQVLMHAAGNDPDCEISALPMLTLEEEEQLLYIWNETSCDYPRDQCVQTLVERTVDNNPNAIAVDWPKGTLTYAELNARANQLAHQLRDRGVGVNSLVALCIERGLDMTVALLGILKAGGAYLPLDPNYPSDRRNYILDHSGASVLLTQDNLRDQLSSDYRQVIAVDSDWHLVSQYPDSNPEPIAGPDDLAYVIYTSGSTGQPKGVSVSQLALVNQCMTAIDHFELGTGQRRLQSASLGFDVATGEIFPTWVAGDTVVLWPGPRLGSLQELLDFVETSKLTIIGQPSSYWHGWVAAIERGAARIPESLRMVVVGSERVLPDRVNVWLEHAPEHIRWCNAYGPTETTITATIYKPAVGEHFADGDIVPIGRPLANTSVYVLDARRQPVPVGVAGEIFIGGDRLAVGYLHDPELTASKFVYWSFKELGPLRLYATGDVGRYRSDGQIEFLGRKDEQIKLRGYRIELGEIRTVLGQHPDLDDVAVIPWEDDKGSIKGILAYAVPAVDDELSETALRDFLKKKLPNYMIPARVIVVDALPLNSHGKLDRQRLPQPAIVDGRLRFVAPTNPIEETLASIWAQLLEKDRVGIHDNFFEMGGHSLTVIQMASCIEETLGVEIALRELLDVPTIAELASAIADLQSITPIRTTPR